jgi:hypothetical protein
VLADFLEPAAVSVEIVSALDMIVEQSKKAKPKT